MYSLSFLSPHPHWYLLLLAILTSMSWNCILLICIFLTVMLDIFPVPVGHLHFLFRKMSIQFFCLYLNWVIFWCWVVQAVYIYLIFIAFQPYHLQIFSLIQYISFHFVGGFLCCAKTFKFNYIPFIFIFISLTLGDGHKKDWFNLCQRMSCLSVLRGVL